MGRFYAMAISATIVTCAIVAGESKSIFPDSEKKADVKRMLDLSGAKQASMIPVRLAIKEVAKEMPKVPEKFWNDITDEIVTDNLYETLVPIYDKHFTHDEIKELIRFYESPIGTKLSSTQPQIMQESAAAGQQSGHKISQKIIQRLKEQGYR